MESRREEKLRRREQTRARRVLEAPEQREERLKWLDVTLSARETLVPEEKEARLPQMETHGRRRTCETHEKTICSRHHMTGGTRGRLDLSMKYLIKTLRLKMLQSKFHADLASIDNTMYNAGSRRYYVGH